MSKITRLFVQSEPEVVEPEKRFRCVTHGKYFKKRKEMLRHARRGKPLCTLELYQFPRWSPVVEGDLPIPDDVLIVAEGRERRGEKRKHRGEKQPSNPDPEAPPPPKAPRPAAASAETEAATVMPPVAPAASAVGPLEAEPEEGPLEFTEDEFERLRREFAEPLPEVDVEYSHKVSLPAEDTLLWKLLHLKQKFSLTNPVVNAIWSTFVNPDQKHVSDQLKTLEEGLVAEIGWAQRGKVRSPIGFLRIIFSMPTIERMILTEPEQGGDVVHEFSETRAFHELTVHVKSIHASEGRLPEDMVAVSLGLFADKHEVTSKTSGQAFLLEVLNTKRSLRNVPFLRFQLAETDGSLPDFFRVLRGALPEFQALAKGVRMWVESEKRHLWVYAFLGVVMSDSQERWRFASVKAPSGNHSCTCCDASREEFAQPGPQKIRDWEKAVNLVKKERRLPTKEAKAHLEKQHLTEWALVNPMFDWPLVPKPGNFFMMLPADPLHEGIFHFKVFLFLLCSALSFPEKKKKREKKRMTPSSGPC